MHPRLADERRDFERLLEETCRYAVSTLCVMDERPVTVRPGAPERRGLSEAGIGFSAALQDFRQRWAPGFSGSAGPRYLGFVTGGVTPAALAGDWLTGTFDQNPTSGLDSSAPDLEREAIGWLRDLFRLSDAQQGCFVSGATLSNTVGLAIAREWVGEQKGIDVADNGVAALGPVKVLSGSPHSSIYKGLSMLGLGRHALIQVPLMQGREAVEIAALDKALQSCGDEPVIVVANCGTVNTVDFDPLPDILKLKERHRFWLHVDAAFGGFAATVPEFAHLVAGLDAADSICIDCHKWLNVPYDSAVQFTRRRDLQLRIFQNAAAYLGAPGENPDFVHLTPENSRRLRALPAWFALAAYGRCGHSDIVARNVSAARRFGELILTEPRLRLMADVRLNVVCFTFAEAPDQSRVDGLIKALRDDGDVFLTPTMLWGVWGVRAAFSNWRTGPEDVERAFSALQRRL